MRYVLDTSVVLQIFAGIRPLDMTGFDELQISSLTYGELFEGVALAKTDIERERRHIALNIIRSHFPHPIPYGLHEASFQSVIATEASSLSRANKVDRMIVATARAHGCVLLTLNGKDLKGIDGVLDLNDRFADTES